MKSNAKHFNWVAIISSGVIIFVSAFCIAAGSSVDDSGTIDFSISFAIKQFTCLVLLLGGYWIFQRAIDYVPPALPNNPSSLRNPFAFSLVLDRRFFAQIGVMCLFWLPYFLALYPGIPSFDTSFQLCQFFGNEMPGVFFGSDGHAFTDHHPFFVTLLFGAVVYLGSFLGSNNIGFALLCVLQMLLTAAAFSFALSYYSLRFNLSKKMLWGCLLFFCLFPTFPFSVMTPTKDSFFSWIYVVFFCLVIEIVLSKGDSLKNIKFLIAVALTVLLLILTKKTSVYILMICALAFLVIFRTNFKRILICFCLPLIIGIIVFPSIFFPVFDVAPGSKVETLGPLYQQSARYVLDHPDDVTDEEKEAIDNVLGYETLADRYHYTIVDTVHHHEDVNQQPTNNQIISYLNAYISQGIRHPESYFYAATSLEAGWFDLDERLIFPQGSGLQLDPPNNQPNIYRPVYLENLAAQASAFANWLQCIPGLNILFVPTLYAFIAPIFVTLYLIKQRKGFPLLVPVWASFLFLLLSPVSTVSTNMEAMRYLLPFIYSAPLLLLSCAAIHLNQRTCKHPLK